MTGKAAEAIGEMLSELAVNAVLAVEENGKVDIDNVKVEKKVGPGIMASEMIKGIVIRQVQGQREACPSRSARRKSC